MAEKSKRSFNSRLSKRERLFQSVPASLVVIFFSIPLFVIGTLAIGLLPGEEQCEGEDPPNENICTISQLVSSAFDNAETIAILSAVVLYLKEAPDRKEKRHYEAWQVVEQAEGKETSYSRYKALQDLNDDDVSLEGLDAPKADLNRIVLPKAKLKGANLMDSDLSLADLSEANLIGANLRGANLKGANLEAAELSKARLHGAKLVRTKLAKANLERAELARADLSGANLVGANLENVDLTSTILAESRLEGANLEGVILEGADLRDVKWSPKTTLWPAKEEVAKAKNIPDGLWENLQRSQTISPTGEPSAVRDEGTSTL